MAKIVNKAELALILGTSERSLTSWQAKGMPILREGERGEENQYDTAVCVKWKVEYEVTKVRQAEMPRDRLARRQAEMVEIQLAERRGESISASAVKPAWLGHVIAARQALRGLPTEIAPALSLLQGADAMRDLLAEAIDAALLKLSEDDGTSPAQPVA